MNFLKKLWKDENGMGVIEIALIILALVSVAIIFKSQLTSIANTVFGNLMSEIETF